MALLGKEDPRVLFMTAAMPASRIYAFFLYDANQQSLRVVCGKNPYHTPVVRILGVAVREGYNYPLLLTWVALSFLSSNLDTVFELAGVFRGRCEGFMSAIAICE